MLTILLKFKYKKWAPTSTFFSVLGFCSQAWFESSFWIFRSLKILAMQIFRLCWFWRSKRLRTVYDISPISQMHTSKPKRYQPKWATDFHNIPLLTHKQLHRNAWYDSPTQSFANAVPYHEYYYIHSNVISTRESRILVQFGNATWQILV